MGAAKLRGPFRRAVVGEHVGISGFKEKPNGKEQESYTWKV